MNDDRRSHEASSLRAFFDGQVHHLQALVDSLSHHVHEEDEQTREDRRIVENFVDASNSRMRAVHGYADKLRGHVCELYNHVLQVADEIPPPVDFNQDAFRTNPLVNALFVYSKDIDKLFNADPAASNYFRNHDRTEVPVLYALLTASKREKPVLGIGMLGDMLIRDVPQQAVNFSSHKIHLPCASSGQLGMAVKTYLFDGVVTLARQEMASRMTDQRLTPGSGSYESRLKSLANPDVYLDALTGFLENPAMLLSVEKNHFKLSKLGIKLDSDDRQCANEFDIHELIWNGNNRWVVLQIAHAR